jgi:predicted phosphodiesterase
MGKPTHHRNIPLIYERNGVVRVDTDRELTVLVCPDTHFPFEHTDTFRFLKHLRDQYQPDIFVHIGDECEFASLSFHEKDPDMPGAADEYKAALNSMAKLYEIFPDALIAKSNHTSRAWRIAFSSGLPSEMIKSYTEILKAPPGYSWHERIMINGVCYIHGDPKSGENAAKSWMQENKCSTVIGHTHQSGGVGYSASPFNQTFWLNCGALIDLEAIPFKYSAKYANKATLGAGLVIGGHTAFFIPMR